MDERPQPRGGAPVVPVIQAPSPEGVGRSKSFDSDLDRARESGAHCIVLDLGRLADADLDCLRRFIDHLRHAFPDFRRLVLVNVCDTVHAHFKTLHVLGRFRARFAVGEELDPTLLTPPKPPSHAVKVPPAAALAVAPVEVAAPLPKPPSGPVAAAAAVRPPSDKVPVHYWSPPGFEVLGELGRGGLASVYKARHTGTGRLVALKVLDPRSAQITPQFVKVFAQEAEILKRMDHENVLRGLGGGSADGRYYVVMEFVDGKSLQDHILEQGTLEEKEALRILGDVTKAVRYLESEAFLHGDIKPGNVMLEPSGRARLCDLGMANWISLDPDATNSNVAMGTKGYLAPEREAGAASIDVRSEIYSLGVTLHRMIAGFPRPSAPGVRPKFGPEFLDDTAIPVNVRWLIAKMTTPNVKLRYVNTDELLRDIGRVLNGTRRFDKDLEELRELYVRGWGKVPGSGP